MKTRKWFNSRYYGKKNELCNGLLPFLIGIGLLKYYVVGAFQKTVRNDLLLDSLTQLTGLIEYLDSFRIIDDFLVYDKRTLELQELKTYHLNVMMIGLKNNCFISCWTLKVCTTHY